jgi:hypothetical protein
MQSFGILVAAPNAAPTEGHAAFSFGATPAPAVVDACPEAGEDGAPPIAPGTEVADVPPDGVKGEDDAIATLAPLGDVTDTNPLVVFVVVPKAFSGSRPGTFADVAVAVPGEPAAPYGL